MGKLGDHKYDADQLRKLWEESGRDTKVAASRLGLTESTTRYHLRRSGVLGESAPAPLPAPAQDTFSEMPDSTPLVRFPDRKKPIGDFMELLDRASIEAAYRSANEPSQSRGVLDFTKHGDEPICIMQMTDVHIGAPQTDYVTLLRHIALLRTTPNLYCILTGDLIEGKANSRHMDATLSQVFPPQMQVRVRQEMFRYLWEKIVVDVDGNHDLYPFIYGGVNVNEFTERGGLWLKDGGRITIKMSGGVEYSVLVLHGDGVAGNSMYDKAAAIERAQRMQFGWHDMAFIGHTHEAQMKIKEEPRSADQGVGPVIVCRGGTYKVLGGEMYPDRMGLGKPSGVFMPAMILFPKKKRILPFFRVEDAVDVLRALLGGKKDE